MHLVNGKAYLATPEFGINRRFIRTMCGLIFVDVKITDFIRYLCDGKR
jgi:hypothetical protein